MASNGIYDCMKGQGIYSDYQQGDHRFKNEFNVKTQKYSQPLAFEIPKNNYRKTPNQQNKTPFKPTFGYEKMNSKSLIEVKENQIGDYYPHHLTFSYDNNQIKQMKTPQKINNNHKTYETFLNKQLQEKEKMTQGNLYEMDQIHSSQQYLGNLFTNRLNSKNSQPNYHLSPLNQNYSRSQDQPTPNAQEKELLISSEMNNNINWDTCFSRRKPAPTKYEYFY